LVPGLIGRNVFRYALMRGGWPVSRSLQACGLRKVTLLVPEGCAEGLRQFARVGRTGELAEAAKDLDQALATVKTWLSTAAAAPKPPNF
jgi:hypothetical protein